MNRKSMSLVAVLLTVVLSVSAQTADTAGSSSELHRLVTWMTGSFSSQEQAERDTNYFDVRLTMVPVWQHRTDGFWLYVEQAIAGKLDKPYRQRVYHVTQENDTTFESAVYTLVNPLRYAGEWKRQMPLGNLTRDSLILREGCSIVLKSDGVSRFVGSTVGTGCASDLRGAAYVTSEVVITDTVLQSWDRGFDKDGKQVWGATGGGYVFKKTKVK